MRQGVHYFYGRREQEWKLKFSSRREVRSLLETIWVSPALTQKEREYMYKIGDYIVKNGNGVCRVENVTYLDIAGIDKNRLYYMLVPIDDENGKIYVPVDSSTRQLRKVMSMEHAYSLIDMISTVQELCISNDKLREQKYKEIIKDYEPESLLSIIKTTYLRRQERLEQGKKTMAVDEYYLALAEKLLFSELCVALEMEKDEVHKLILEAANK